MRSELELDAHFKDTGLRKMRTMDEHNKKWSTYIVLLGKVLYSSFLFIPVRSLITAAAMLDASWPPGATWGQRNFDVKENTI